ncbi:hypothetical protein BKA83DRAFT_4122535 [Pisolithus microcarpus]|nr:hypothetical protein BKA83DRAFT_4122535 [Pisolithus microcarpus]
MLADEAQASHASRSTLDDAGHASKMLAISPMPVDPPPVYPDTSSSKDKGSSRHITTNETTDVSCHAQSGQDASEANQSHSHTISATLPTSPDDDGCVEAPRKIHTSTVNNHDTNPQVMDVQLTNKRPKPWLLTQDDRASAHDSKNAFNLHHRMWRPASNVALMTLSAPSAGLIAAEEGRACKDGDQVEIGDVGHIEMEDARLGADRGTGESRQNMAGQHLTGLPLQYVYDYHPMHHPGIRYERDPYAAQYHVVRGFPDHLPGFVHDPWEDGHANYEDWTQYVRDGIWYGPPDLSHRVQVSQVPYPPPRTHPNDAIPSYYYHGTRSQPHTQFHTSPVLCISPQADCPSGAVPGPSQHHSYPPPAQSTMSVQNRNTSPEPEANTN